MSFQSLGKRVEIIAESIESVAENTNNIHSKTQNSNKQLTDLATSINDVSTSFVDIQEKVDTLKTGVQRITEITSFINDIANQTNLLSLNASIEASRAGEAGRGFAVVAGEIRKLAEESRHSAENISELLDGIHREMGQVAAISEKTNVVLSQQTKVVRTTLEAFRDINESIEIMMPQIGEIRSSVQALNTEKDTILQAVVSTSAVAEENSASSEGISAASVELASSSDEVANSVKELEMLTKEMIHEVKRFTLN
ncbi:MAG TPA: methyl-accepting chemotaxis protein [Bacillota bacterium]|nr:methyl-accepting chemotaxis protein [Bacillota bacterium]